MPVKVNAVMQAAHISYLVAEWITRKDHTSFTHRILLLKKEKNEKSAKLPHISVFTFAQMSVQSSIIGMDKSAATFWTIKLDGIPRKMNNHDNFSPVTYFFNISFFQYVKFSKLTLSANTISAPN